MSHVHPHAGDKPGWFTRFAHRIAVFSGKPTVFFAAMLIVIIWGGTGPIFHFSDTWQLVINTGTTIVTFLMVFLIQHTQNRDTISIQLKLSELVIAVKGAEDGLANVEDYSDEELERLQAQYRELLTHRKMHRQMRKL